MKRQILIKRPGFTLIELVVTIALAGFVFLMILPFFQSGITDSHKPAQWLQDAVAIQRVMENLNGVYGRIANKDSAALQTLSNAIGSAGSSFNNMFGTYTVLENLFIQFKNNGDEESGGTAVLKVTICSPTNPGHQLTQLFTIQVPH